MPSIPDDACLHCALMATIDNWFERRGEKLEGRVVIDLSEAINKLAQCAVEMAEAGQDRSARRRAFRFAHDALDAHLRVIRTGKNETLNIPSEH